MQLQRNLVRVSTRPLVLVVAILSAIVIGLVATYLVQTSAASPAGKQFVFVQDRPGPDSPYRLQHDVPDPWSDQGN